jgi:hypothetical protein
MMRPSTCRRRHAEFRGITGAAADINALFRELPRLGPTRVEAVATGASRALKGTFLVVSLLLNGAVLLLWATTGAGAVWPIVVLVPTTILLVMISAGLTKASRLLRRNR